MPNFTIETPGGKRLTIEAPDESTAMRGAQEWHAQQQQPKVTFASDPMGTDGISGDSLRAARAGDTRSQMRPQDIAAAYDVAQQRGDKPEQTAMARAFAQNELANSTGSKTGMFLKSMARGIPFAGEYLDEAIPAILHPLDAKAREKARDYEQQINAEYDKQNPITSLGAKAAGGIGSTIAVAPAVAGKAAGWAFGLGAKTIPSAIARGTVAGVAQGAAAGYGKEGTLEGTARDALIGGAIGGVAPAALGAGAMGFRKATEAIAPGDALSSVPSRARDYFVKQFGDDGAIEGVKAKLRDVGPNAVLADVSPEMQMIARGAASRPGTRDQIVNVLLGRDAGKNARIGAAIDENLGRVVEPSAIVDQIARGKQALSPMYENALEQARAVDTKALADQISAQIVNARGPVRSALEDARGMLNLHGTQFLDPSPRALFETRKALDGLVGAADRSGNTAVVRALSGVRNSVDETLANSVPGIKATDAQYGQLAQQAGALEDGAKIFRSGPEAMRPTDLASRVKDAAIPKGEMVGPSAEPLRLSQGARAEIDRIIGSNANDVSAMRSLLKGEGDWNRAKLATVFGKDKADKVLRVLDNETLMENTYRTIVGGSQTAQTQGFKDFLNDTAKGLQVPSDATLTGGALKGAKKLFETISGNNSAAKAEKFAADLGRLSVSGGPEAEAIIQAVLKRQGQAKTNEKLADILGRSGVGAARADDPAGVKAAIAAMIMGRNYLSDPERSRPR